MYVSSKAESIIHTDICSIIRYKWLIIISYIVIYYIICYDRLKKLVEVNAHDSTC